MLIPELYCRVHLDSRLQSFERAQGEVAAAVQVSVRRCSGDTCSPDYCEFVTNDACEAEASTIDVPWEARFWRSMVGRKVTIIQKV